MTNPIPFAARNVIYLACIVAAAVVLNAPAIIAAVQSGDWSTAASQISATLMLVGGIVAKQNLTADVPAPAAPEIAAEDPAEDGAEPVAE